MPIFSDKRVPIHYQKDEDSSVYTVLFNPEESLYDRRDAFQAMVDSLNVSIQKLEEEVKEGQKDDEKKEEDVISVEKESDPSSTFFEKKKKK